MGMPTDVSSMLGPGKPVPCIEVEGGLRAATARVSATQVDVPDAVVSRLEASGAAVLTDDITRAEASRDWWPVAALWAVEGGIASVAGAVVRPADAKQVAEVAAICNEARLPLTVAAGRSGTVGGAVPAHGGVLLDLTDLTGFTVDDTSLRADVAAGTFGDHFEHGLRSEYGLTAGHWPQSMTLATVGGWVACRGAGQLSTRYGKIEDIVSGLEVVLADGTTVTTGGKPRQAVGPDLTQLFVGSEGTLGIITRVSLKLHPAPSYERRLAVAFPSFQEGLDACRRILRRGATPAVLRLYDALDSAYHFAALADFPEGACVVLVLDEGDEPIVEGTFTVVEQETTLATTLPESLVEHWLAKRNDVSAFAKLVEAGLVVDTMEVAASWGDLPAVYETTISAIKDVPGVLTVMAHQSHSYTDGACLYFTWAGQPGAGTTKGELFKAAWDAGTRASLAAGASLSHHHGVGLSRARFVPAALGAGFDVLAATKRALDPNGILNPGKLGLDDPWGAISW